MDDMVYSVVRAQALRTLNEMVEETNWTEPGPVMRLRTKLRTAVGKRLIQMGTLLAGASSTEPRKQTQSA